MAISRPALYPSYRPAMTLPQVSYSAMVWDDFFRTHLVDQISVPVENGSPPPTAHQFLVLLFSAIPGYTDVEETVAKVL